MLSVYTVVAATIAALMMVLTHGDCIWLTYDAHRFHAMAAAIIAGLTPYLDFVDPKPPLLFGTVAAFDGLAPPGTPDIVLVTGVNIFSAMVLFTIGHDRYGWVSGFTSGLLFLVAAAAAQGYLLFSEQFAALFLLLGLHCAIGRHYTRAGVMAGLAGGFKQYALVALIPLLYLMWIRGDRNHAAMVGGFIAALGIPFLVIFIVYGPEAVVAALYWTFGVSPAYLTGSLSAVPDYLPDNILSFAANLILSVTIVLPTLVFAAGSIIRNGLATPEERTVAFLAALFMATLLIRQYLHYWILIVPFLALLACREFRDKPPARRAVRDLG